MRHSHPIRPEPEPQPEQQTNLDTDVENTAGSTPVVQQAQPWQIPANQQAANECSNGVISLSPVSAVYTDNNDIVSGGDLLIDGDNQRAFLNFDLSGIPANVASTALTFNVGTEAGQQLPDISHFIGSFDGTWNAATRYGIPFDPALIAGDTTTLVMEMAQGANGITVVSSDSLLFVLTMKRILLNRRQLIQNLKRTQTLRMNQTPAVVVRLPCLGCCCWFCYQVR